jgi:glycerol-3-phosphate acyltransferase PlsX
VICHGSSNGKAIKNAIRVAREFYEAKLNEHIENDINELAAVAS